MQVEPDKRAFFEAKVSAMMERLYGTAMRFTRNAADAEDLVADTLIKAWDGFGKLEDQKKFDGWIMRILSNTYISNWRRQKTANRIFDSNLDTNDLDDAGSLYARLHQPFLLWYGTPEQTFINNLLNEDIEKALNALADGYRIVVIMVEILGFSYDEAATSLEVPVGTVRSRLNRGRRLLQEALWQNAEEAGIVSDSE
jgi:RNA polymerase sigma-70 factor (ECF subfamily)